MSNNAEEYTMNNIKHTPLPWFQSHCKNADGETYSTKVYDHQGVIAVLEWYPIALGEGVTGTRREANAEFIVTACNEYYNLKKENERLRGTIGELREVLTKAVDAPGLVPSIRLKCKSALSKFQPKKDESVQ